MKRILHIENSKTPTGSMHALQHILEAAHANYDSIVAFPKGSKNRRIIERLGIRVVEFPFVEIRKSVRVILLYIPVLIMNAVRLYGFCLKNNVDIIHNNDHYNLAPVLLKMFWRRIILVTHVRLLPSTYNASLYGVFRFLNKRFSDYIIAVSNAVAKAYGTTEKIKVGHDSYPLPELYDAYVVRESDVIRFLYFANYISGKGQDHAIQAFAKHLEVHPYAELHFYGGTMYLSKNEAYKSSLFEAAKHLGVEKNVFFHSFCEDPESVYKSHDISLIFSDSESFSMVCYESMYYGLPVIATDCGGPSEMIDSGISGILVPVRDVPAMAAAMSQLSADTSLRETFSVRGKKRIREMISVNKSLYSIIDLVLEKKRMM